MPKRTNPFQKLVKLIEDQMWPLGATVTEPAMLRDKRTGEEREVDILIEFEAGGKTFRVAVECRDHKERNGKPKPQGLNWIDGVEGTCRHILPKIDKIILVSASGFWSTAPLAAKNSELDIEILSLEEAHNADWSSITLPREVEIVIAQVSLDQLTLHILPKPETELVIDPSRVRIFHPLFPAGHGKLSAFINMLFKSKYGDLFLGEIVRNWDANKGEFKDGLQGVIVEIKDIHDITGVVEDSSRWPFLLLSLEFEFGCTASENSLIELRRSEYRNAQISHGKGKVGGVDMAFAAVESPNEEDGTFAFTFGDLNSVDPNSHHDSGKLPLRSVLIPASDKDRRAALTFFALRTAINFGRPVRAIE